MDAINKVWPEVSDNGRRGHLGVCTAVATKDGTMCILVAQSVEDLRAVMDKVFNGTPNEKEFHEVMVISPRVLTSAPTKEGKV